MHFRGPVALDRQYSVPCLDVCFRDESCVQGGVDSNSLCVRKYDQESHLCRQANCLVQRIPRTSFCAQGCSARPDLSETAGRMPHPLGYPNTSAIANSPVQAKMKFVPCVVASAIRHQPQVCGGDTLVRRSAAGWQVLSATLRPSVKIGRPAVRSGRIRRVAFRRYWAW